MEACCSTPSCFRPDLIFIDVIMSGIFGAFVAPGTNEFSSALVFEDFGGAIWGEWVFLGNWVFEFSHRGSFGLCSGELQETSLVLAQAFFSS